MLESVQAKLKVLGILDNRSLMALEKATPDDKTLQIREEHIKSYRSGDTGMTMLLVLGLMLLATVFVHMIMNRGKQRLYS